MHWFRADRGVASARRKLPPINSSNPTYQPVNPTFIRVLTVTAALAAVPFHGFAQTAPAAPLPADKPAAAGLLAQVKQPVPWLLLGGDIRMRNEYYNTAVTLAEAPLREQDLFRFRARISAAITAAPNVTLNARLAAEARYWMRPAFVGAFKGQTGFEQRFAQFDNLALKWTRLFDLPATLTLGRQDIMLGDPLDWWLVMDGTPAEGSWTTYFDAARLTVEAKSIHTTFDAIALVQFTQPDEWLPTLGRSTSYPVTDQKETGVILYASNKSLPNTQVDGYFMSKHDDQQYATVAGVTRLCGDNADIHTLGSKITGTPVPHLRYSLEGAYQFGHKQDRVSGVIASRDLRAFGGKGRLTYLFKDAWNNQVSLNGEYLSGDDPTTAGKDEMFDVLWGRWPMWSELYIYSVICETGGRIAQMNNLSRIGASWNFAPVKGTTVNVAYNALFAPEAVPTRATVPALFSNRGHFRGNQMQVWVKRQFNKHLSGHVWAECVSQGDFYTHREVLTFFRGELAVSF